MSPGGGAGGQTADFREYQWSYSVMDSSRVSTCLISMLLIVYGSFRSLNMEQEQREREKKRQNDSMNNLLTGEPVHQEQSEFAFHFHHFFMRHSFILSLKFIIIIIIILIVQTYIGIIIIIIFQCVDGYLVAGNPTTFSFYSANIDNRISRCLISSI